MFFVDEGGTRVTVRLMRRMGCLVFRVADLALVLLVALVLVVVGVV